jgi:hypothetical protein
VVLSPRRIYVTANKIAARRTTMEGGKEISTRRNAMDVEDVLGQATLGIQHLEVALEACDVDLLLRIAVICASRISNQNGCNMM